MTMEHSENYPNSQRGATRETRRAPSTRAVLKAWMDDADNPHSNDERHRLLKQFQEFMHSTKGKQHLDAVAEYWFTNHFRALLADYPVPGAIYSKRVEAKQTAQVVREEKAVDLTQRVAKAIEAKAQILLLDMMTPTGKPLRDCTGSECRQMGGWYLQIAERVKPKQRVSAVLQEIDVRKLYQE